MNALLNKEIKLSSSILSWLFVAFSLMALIPGYPILVGAFFVCLGIFQSYQAWRENNDILYTALLPVKKTDVVKAKLGFTVLIQMISFVIALALTILRMTALKNSSVYVTNVMMNANQFYLAAMLIIYALFNLIFVCGFFRTAYKFAKPFVTFIVVSFIAIGIAEALHHIPGLEFLNANDSMGSAVMWIILLIGAVVYIAAILLAYRISANHFEKIDL